MIYQTCSENEKLFTKIFRINGLNPCDRYDGIINASFSDALNGRIDIVPHTIDGNIGPLLPRNAIVRSALINFYGQTIQETKNPYQRIALPLQAKVIDVYATDSSCSQIAIEISGPKIEDESTLTAKREQLIDFDLVIFYTLLE